MIRMIQASKHFTSIDPDACSLRGIHDLKALYPKDARLVRWAAAVHKIYAAAKTFTHPDDGKGGWSN